MDLLDVMRTTPSVREFTSDPVPDDVVHDLLDAARFAPNGGNRQGWRVVVLKDPELRAKVRDLYVLCWREYVAHLKAGLVPFAPIDNGHWTGPAVDLDEALATEVPNDFADHFDEVPVLLAVVVDLSTLAVMDNGLDRQSIVGGGSVYPFCHNVMLAARDAGLAGVMTTMLCRREPEMAELLGIPVGHALAAVLAIGHPVKQLTKLRRDPVEAFTTVDRLDGEPFA